MSVAVRPRQQENTPHLSPIPPLLPGKGRVSGVQQQLWTRPSSLKASGIPLFSLPRTSPALEGGRAGAPGEAWEACGGLLCALCGHRGVTVLSGLSPLRCPGVDTAPQAGAARRTEGGCPWALRPSGHQLRAPSEQGGGGAPRHPLTGTQASPMRQLLAYLPPGGRGEGAVWQEREGKGGVGVAPRRAVPLAWSLHLPDPFSGVPGRDAARGGLGTQWGVGTLTVDWPGVPLPSG